MLFGVSGLLLVLLLSCQMQGFIEIMFNYPSFDGYRIPSIKTSQQHLSKCCNHNY